MAELPCEGIAGAGRSDNPVYGGQVITTAEIAEIIAKYAENAILKNCYSLSKNEIVFSFAKGKNVFHVQAFFGSSSFIFFPENHSLKNVLPAFQSIWNKEVSGVFLHKNDRSFNIEFKNIGCLIFKLYGRNGNIVLCEPDKENILFKTQFRIGMNLMSDIRDLFLTVGSNSFYLIYHLMVYKC